MFYLNQRKCHISYNIILNKVLSSGKVLFILTDEFTARDLFEYVDCMLFSRATAHNSIEVKLPHNPYNLKI